MPGFRGIVLRFRASLDLTADGDRVMRMPARVLQELVDFTITRGLKGLETLAGIPGSVGAAVYGNAGAYGHSISERVRQRAFFRRRASARFRQRRSANSTIAKAFSSATKTGSSSRPNCRWIRPTPPTLRETADGIVKIRNEKFPPTMKCAGSIFKNLLLANLPPAVGAQVPARRPRRQGSVRLVSRTGRRQRHAARRHPRRRLSRQPDLQRGRAARPPISCALIAGTQNAACASASASTSKRKCNMSAFDCAVAAPEALFAARPACRHFTSGASNACERSSARIPVERARTAGPPAYPSLHAAAGPNPRERSDARFPCNTPCRAAGGSFLPRREARATRLSGVQFPRNAPRAARQPLTAPATEQQSNPRHRDDAHAPFGAGGAAAVRANTRTTPVQGSPGNPSSEAIYNSRASRPVWFMRRTDARSTAQR